MPRPPGKLGQLIRRLRVRARRGSVTRWRDFRTGLNVSWLALRDRSIGWAPKVLGVLVALVGVMPLEWVPGIHPFAVLVANFVAIPALLWLAWLAVWPKHKELLVQQARKAAMPWAFLTVIAAIFATSSAIDLALEFAYPGQDAFSPVIEDWVEVLLGPNAN